ncbi:MAG: hypothetical protein UY90_C0012G0021 [Candidatus Peregrinibacteria bacterium GW2011_GWA2_54_9]|nr:MAG: hypothetical protein UY90_C0012G0021 [Candidatus Peregrinibacteria bacterium GW2011_GWA2_54_9]
MAGPVLKNTIRKLRFDRGMTQEELFQMEGNLVPV